MPTKDVYGDSANSSRKPGRSSGPSPTQRTPKPSPIVKKSKAGATETKAAPGRRTPKSKSGTRKQTATIPKQKTETQPSTNQPRSGETRASESSSSPESGPNGYPLLSLSQLSEHCDIDRSVARRRLQAAKIKPVRSQAKKKLYELTPEIEELLGDSGNPRLDEVKLREAEAKARLKEMDVETRSGRSVDFEEACEYFGELIKSLHNRFVSQYAPAAAGRLHKLKTARELRTALKRDFAKIFGEFRADPRRFTK